MAIELVKVINEILIRTDANGKHKGCSIRFLTYMTDNGIRVLNSDKLENPVDTDWNSKEIKDYLSIAFIAMEKENQSLHVSIEKTNADARDVTSEFDAMATEIASHKITIAKKENEILGLKEDLKNAAALVSQSDMTIVEPVADPVVTDVKPK